MQIGSLDMPVVDVDTHVVEAPDLWTSRLPKKWIEHAPQVRWDDSAETLMWFMGDKRVFPALAAAHSGWREYAPGHPHTWEEADPAAYDTRARVARMDEYGITVQVLYPNVAMFTSGSLQEAHDEQLQNELIRAYNDWQIEWCSYAPERFAPMISVPFWNLEATEKEIERCHDLGFKGVVFTQDPTAFKLPALIDPHWDRLWALTQERKLPINFHVGSGFGAAKNNDLVERHTGRQLTVPERAARLGALTFMSNANTMTQLIIGGVCHRFPNLNFVSVESGAGYVKFVLETLDWQWQNNGLAADNPDYLLPSEYFRRQIYATFWFERQSAIGAIDAIGSTNLMYETDFPHPTSMTPGPGSPAAVAPNKFVNDVLSILDEDDLRNIMYRNAAQIYHLDAVLAAA